MAVIGITGTDMTRATAKKVEQALADKPTKVDNSLPGLSTGVSLINLLLTGDPGYGIQRGTYLFIVGDSSAGKSFLATTIAANAAIDPNFKDYEIIYDDVENGAMFDVSALFSPAVAARFKTPSASGVSVFVEDFYVNVRAAMKRGPCVYVLDSENGLTSREEAAKDAEMRAAIAAIEKKGGRSADAIKNIKSLMVDPKPKKHSQNLRTVVSEVEKTGSILIILGQTRDNLTDTFAEVIHSGGRALKFYAHVMAYMTGGERLTKTVNERKREIGVVSRFKLIKNRYNGKRDYVAAPIYYTVGYDEIGSMVDWLVEEKVWDSDNVIDTDGFMENGKRETLIKRIDSDPELEERLRSFVEDQWYAIEAKLRVFRRNRYTLET